MNKKNNIFFALFLIVFLNSCALRERAVYRDVNVAVKCDIEVPSRPSKNENVTQQLSDILIYTENLELILKYCAKK